jgi:hypothetical protein
MDVNSGFTVDATTMYNNISGYFTNPNFYIIITVIILICIFIFIGLGGRSRDTSTNTEGSSTTSTGTSSGKIVKIFVGSIFFICLILFIIWVIPKNIWDSIGMFNYTTTTELNNTFSDNPTIDINVQNNTETNNTTNPILSRLEQVFNIPGNYYRYEEAETLCQAYGARLANYEEVEQSYNKGAEWCNYGWSDGQMALFPTQAETYQNLQSIPGHEHDCGRPGVNGGYIANPRVRFGVNCYGIKPKITDQEKELMASTTPYQMTEKDILKEEQIDYWKTKLDNILVSPFNYQNWSKV